MSIPEKSATVTLEPSAEVPQGLICLLEALYPTAGRGFSPALAGACRGSLEVVGSLQLRQRGPSRCNSCTQASTP
eukprot:scaffold65142_cov15-Prasinocladus_malaysianus.AAC.1